MILKTLPQDSLVLVSLQEKKNAELQLIHSLSVWKFILIVLQGGIKWDAVRFCLGPDRLESQAETHKMKFSRDKCNALH